MSRATANGVTGIIVRKLPTQYWCVSFDSERFVQWPHGRLPTLDDVFPRGWATQREVDTAIAAVEAHRQSP